LGERSNRQFFGLFDVILLFLEFVTFLMQDFLKVVPELCF